MVAPMVRQGAPNAKPVAMPAFQGKLSDREIAAVADYVAGTLSDPAARSATSSEGGTLYRLYCAGCHSTTGRGGALAGGQNAPRFQGIPGARAWAAMIRGPGNMPAFAGSAFDVRQQAAVGRYVNVLTAPPSPGGQGLGWIGPVVEGAVAMLAVVGLVLVGVWLAWRKGGSSA
jgi:ubiquinol-cytochrome c reductase cytochrome c subunit